MKITGEILHRLNRDGLSKTDLCRRYNITRQQYDKMVRQDATPPEFEVLNLGTPFDLSGDYVIVGDVHIPATDWSFARLVGMVADKLQIPRLIIAGDFLNADFASTYRVIAPPATWREERDAARVLLHDWLETFSEIYVIQGNHDRRITNWAAAEFDEIDIWGMISSSNKLHISKFGYLTVNSGGIPWRVTHPKNYSINQLTVASELAQKYQTNVISHHEHHLGLGWDRYKRFVCVNNGCLVDIKKLAYAHLDDSKIAGMAQGFTVIKNGCPKVYGRYPFTDWAEVL